MLTQLREDDEALLEEDRQRIMEFQNKNLVERGKRQGKTDRNSAHWGTNSKTGNRRSDEVNTNLEACPCPRE